MEDLADRLLALIKKHPGLTERELAISLKGPDGYQQQVNQTLRKLRRQGRVVRRGRGGTGDPYRNYPG
jgi:hypothetical protein